MTGEISLRIASALLAVAISGQAFAAELPPHKVPVSDAPFTRTNRSITVEDFEKFKRGGPGIYDGSPQVKAKEKWLEENFYNTLAARKVWSKTKPEDHQPRDPVTWTYEPIPQYTPPPCSEPQPTGYDAEGCRIALSLYKDLEQTDPDKAAKYREMVRKGRDVWHKGSFGNQEQQVHNMRSTEGIWFEKWLHTSSRNERFSKWGLINDPDCEQGDASTFWTDKCQDPHSPGVLGYRKYFKEKTADFDPATTPYAEGEMAGLTKRWHIGGTCTQCHVAFDPTNPPKDPNHPKWENISEFIGNQYVNQPLAGFFPGLPEDHFAYQALYSARIGTVDTSLNPNDFQHNPGTQNNVTDFMNKRQFIHKMKHPITGEVKDGATLHVLKGGEDSVGDRLALARVYVNIGMCTEECWVPNFPVPGAHFGDAAKQKPFSIKQCAQDCEPWNYADAKMPLLGFFLMTGGPTYLLKATDVDGTPGSKHIDLSKVAEGRKIYVRECARCHSSVPAPEAIRSNKDELVKFYDGHVFGSEEYWEHEFTEAERNDPAFQAKFLKADEKGVIRPVQFAEKGMYGQDWLSNDERMSYTDIGTNKCRAFHDNHSVGHIWDEFASITYQNWPAAAPDKKVLGRLLPGIGGREMGEQKIDGGRGYYKPFSLLSTWATAPYLHNNAIGEVTYLPGTKTPDYTVKGRIDQFHLAFEEIMMSDNPNVTPHRTPKTALVTADFKLAPREDGQGLIKLPVHKGTPVAAFASNNPHEPIFQKCDDLVENKGHQFGIDLTPEQKLALREFLKLM